MLTVLLQCSACQWRTVCAEAEIVRRLQTLGVLRRAKSPPEDLLEELLRAQAHRLVCDGCGHTGLLILPTDEASGRDDWQQAVVCEVCHQPIPPERLDVFPQATHCVACQEAAERGEQTAEPEFCPKCGALLELRVSRGSGITRYKQFCTGSPPCRL